MDWSINRRHEIAEGLQERLCEFCTPFDVTIKTGYTSETGCFVLDLGHNYTVSFSVNGTCEFEMVLNNGENPIIFKLADDGPENKWKFRPLGYDLSDSEIIHCLASKIFAEVIKLKNEIAKVIRGIKDNCWVVTKDKYS